MVRAGTGHLEFSMNVPMNAQASLQADKSMSVCFCLLRKKKKDPLFQVIHPALLCNSGFLNSTHVSLQGHRALICSNPVKAGTKGEE